MALDDDKERTAQEIFDCVTNPDRRGFLKRTRLATMAATLRSIAPLARPPDKRSSASIFGPSR